MCSTHCRVAVSGFAVAARTLHWKRVVGFMYWVFLRMIALRMIYRPTASKEINR